MKKYYFLLFFLVVIACKSPGELEVTSLGAEEFVLHGIDIDECIDRTAVLWETPDFEDIAGLYSNICNGIKVVADTVASNETLIAYHIRTPDGQQGWVPDYLLSKSICKTNLECDDIFGFGGVDVDGFYYEQDVGAHCQDNVCIGCTDSSQCDRTEVCDVVKHTCVECVSNADCGQGKCNPLSQVCVECVEDSDCKGKDFFCEREDAYFSSCVKITCERDSDCEIGERCKNRLCV